jgi:ankyrin repeat protein
MGADVTASTIDGETALYRAIHFERIDIINQIIELGADVNAITEVGITILRQAVATGKLEIVQLIVESGANVNQADLFGASDINLAAQKSNWDIVKYLVENGANINHWCDTCKPVIYEAFRSQNLEIIYWLINLGALEFIVQNELRILHECLHFQNEEDRFKLLKILINFDVNINELDSKNESILHKCINNINIVDYLLEKGININIRNNRGRTELHSCFDTIDANFYCQNKSKIVYKLIKHGAVVNTAGNNGVTPLHRAVFNPHFVDIVRILIANGADVHAKDNKGNSVLHYTKDRETAIMLCEQGVKINCTNKEGLTVLEYQIKHGPGKKMPKYCNIIKLLESRSIGLKNTLMSSNLSINHVFMSRYYKFIEFLVDMSNK